MELFKQRLKEAVQKAGGVKAVAKQSGIAASTLYNYLAGRQSPSVDVIVTICEKANIHPGWLMGHDYKADPIEVRPIIRIPLYDITVSAGAGSTAWAEQVRDELAFNASWIRERFGDPANLALFRIIGDSQEPLLSTNDILMVDRSQRKVADGLHVVRSGDDLSVKRLQRISAGRVLLLSANEAYPPYEVDLEKEGDQFEIVGRGVWMGRTLV